MNKKIFSTIITVLMVLAVTTSTASAGGNVGLKGVQFSLGSLDMAGTLTGLGGYPDGVEAHLIAVGNPVVTCISPGGKDNPPGQNPSQVTATATQDITAILKNGTAPVILKAKEPTLTAKQGGCSNNNWTARIDFVFWTHATIVVTDLSNNAVLLHQEYSCATTRTPTASVSCSLIP